MTRPKHYRRTDASKYLLEKWYLERKPSTLAKLAVIGGGPRFIKANHIPLYPETELDIWAESIMSPLLNSTSDSGGRR